MTTATTITTTTTSTTNSTTLHEEENDETEGTWFCTLIGLTPPHTQHWKSLTSNLSSLPNFGNLVVPLRWTSSYSMARNVDEEGSPWTLICTVHSREPATPSHVLHAVQSWFDGTDEDENGGGRGDDVTCELWASAPAPLPLRPFQEQTDNLDDSSFHSVYDFLILNDEEDEEENPNQKVMHEWGIMIQPRLLPSTQVSELVPLAMDAIQTMEHALMTLHPTIRMGYDSFAFTEIASRTQERFDLRIDPKSTLGQRLHHMVLESNLVAKRYIQDMFPSWCASWDDDDAHNELSLDFGLIYSKPGATHQGWHADGHHLPGRMDAGWEEKESLVRLPPLHALCLFVPLTDLDSTVGYTQFWPGSHRHRALVGFGPVAPLVHATYDGMVDAGDAIWYDYRLLHRGMPNVSKKHDKEKGTVRCIVQVIVKQKAYADPVNFGTQSVFSH